MQRLCLAESHALWSIRVSLFLHLILLPRFTSGSSHWYTWHPYIQSIVPDPRFLLPGSAGADDLVDIFYERRNGTVDEKTGHYTVGALQSANVAQMSGTEPLQRYLRCRKW